MQTITLTEQEITAALLQAKKKQYHQDLIQGKVRETLNPPVNYFVDYSTYPLTEIEQKEVLERLLAKKQSDIKAKEYFEKIKQEGRFSSITDEQLFRLILGRLYKLININTRTKKMITEQNADIVRKLIPYLMGFENELYDPNKGLLFIGGTGTGKTAIMTSIGDTPMGRFDLHSCELVADYYAEDPTYFFNQYVNNPIQPNILFDDFGFETAKQQPFQKSVEEPMLIALVKRHELGLFRQTRITTNLNGDMIEKRYGQRLRSRLREMCNVIILNGRDLRG
jgi:DNA replication protein DnaC